MSTYQCSSCGREIEAAPRCPHCGAEQGQWADELARIERVDRRDEDRVTSASPASSGSSPQKMQAALFQRDILAHANEERLKQATKPRRVLRRRPPAAARRPPNPACRHRPGSPRQQRAPAPAATSRPRRPPPPAYRRPGGRPAEPNPGATSRRPPPARCRTSCSASAPCCSASPRSSSPRVATSSRTIQPAGDPAHRDRADAGRAAGGGPARADLHRRDRSPRSACCWCRSTGTRSGPSSRVCDQGRSPAPVFAGLIFALTAAVGRGLRQRHRPAASPGTPPCSPSSRCCRCWRTSGSTARPAGRSSWPRSPPSTCSWPGVFTRRRPAGAATPATPDRRRPGPPPAPADGAPPTGEPRRRGADDAADGGLDRPESAPEEADAVLDRAHRPPGGPPAPRHPGSRSNPTAPRPSRIAGPPPPRRPPRWLRELTWVLHGLAVGAALLYAVAALVGTDDRAGRVPGRRRCWCWPPRSAWSARSRCDRRTAARRRRRRPDPRRDRRGRPGRRRRPARPRAAR